MTDPVADILGAASRGKGLVSAFQPVVSLPSETTVGYEALARWPTLNNPKPADVFAHAEKTAQLDFLDCACIDSAARGALEGASSNGMLLLINCEPATAYIDPIENRNIERAADSFRLGFEFTERGLLSNPHAVLRKVAALRSQGFLIALDDIGARPETLALLDIVAPEILKLDMGLIQHQPDQVLAHTVAAVIAHHERTGALICAEGIETDDHLEQALAYGATLGQGDLFGPPGEITVAPLASSWPVPKTHTVASNNTSTFDLATAGMPTRTVRRQTLIELSCYIERLAISAESSPIVLSVLPKSENMRTEMAIKYFAIAEKSPLVAVFGENVPAELESPIRGVRLDPTDPLSHELTILILGPHTAAGLIAREHHGPRNATEITQDRRFDVMITFDRERVTIAARSLLDRLR